MWWTTMRGALLLGAGGLCIWACGSPDRAPPYIDPKEFVIGGAAGAGGETTGLSGTLNGGGAAGSPTTTGAEFDPSQVFMWGTLDPNCETRDVIAQWETPNDYVSGFARGMGMPYLRDGRLLYRGAGIYEFVSDGWGHEPLQTFPYVIYPNNNDIRIETPGGCPEPFRYVVGPTGTMLHACEEYYLGPLDWYDQTGDMVLKKGFVSALGNGDLALLGTGDVMTLSDRVIHPPPTPGESPGTMREDPFFAERSHSDGFHVVSGDTLSQVDAEGTWTKLGAYPDPPSGVNPGVGHAVLTPDDVLFHIGSMFDTQLGYPVYVIVRRTLDGQSEIVFNAARGSYVQLYIYSTLFSGP
jgi:hypothetical protein